MLKITNSSLRIYMYIHFTSYLLCIFHLFIFSIYIFLLLCPVENKLLIFNALILGSENYDQVNIFTLIVIKFILIFYLLISLFLFLMLSSRFPPSLLSAQFSSVIQSCPTLCDPMDCSMSGFPVHRQLLELAQIHVHWVGDAIQPSHHPSSTSPAFNLAQHQDLFQRVSSLHQVAQVLEFQLQHQSFQWIFRTDFL